MIIRFTFTTARMREKPTTTADKTNDRLGRVVVPLNGVRFTTEKRQRVKLENRFFFSNHIRSIFCLPFAFPNPRIRR